MPSYLKHNIILSIFTFLLLHTATAQPSDTLNGQYFQEFSARLLESVRDGRNVTAELQQLAKFSPDMLSAALNNDDLRKTFWLNIYNTAAQVALKNDSTLILRKAAYPEKNIIHVAGKHLSLDFILHRILRRSKNKFGLGYIGRVIISDYEKMFRTDYVDYRLHFAINNGSASCGPADFYRVATLNDQLNQATVFFLHKECVYNDTLQTVTLPQMLEWYKADFGGEKGMLQFLEKLLIIPAGKKTKLRFREYDWRLRLNHFR
jgi:hypothetical protein